MKVPAASSLIVPVSTIRTNRIIVHVSHGVAPQGPYSSAGRGFKSLQAWPQAPLPDGCRVNLIYLARGIVPQAATGPQGQARAAWLEEIRRSQRCRRGLH